MKVFKFGGASVKDAEAVKNVFRILAKYPGEDLIVVFSAMGKTTNALEKVADSWYSKSPSIKELQDDVFSFHLKIASDLGLENFRITPVMKQLEGALEEEPPHFYDQAYDRIVSFGELISTDLISQYLAKQGFDHCLLDCRSLIKTDNTYRNANIDWQETKAMVKEGFQKHRDCKVYITQGFIGSSLDGIPVTLGREGSDFSAAILAWAVDSSEVVIWKDVPGVLNADPRYFPNTIKLTSMSYRDAIELAYYGASVIHPKTIQPLKSKNIPLKVKSFYNPDDDGTIITDIANYTEIEDSIPCFITKSDQLLISISPKDFSFIAEGNLHYIFGQLSALDIHINMMQLSAISFSIVVDEDKRKIEKLFKILDNEYSVRYNMDLQLFTIKYYNQRIIDEITNGREIYLEQKSRNTVQLVIGN
jgi:aspartate kinase